MRGVVVASVLVGAACGGSSEDDGEGARSVSTEAEARARNDAAAKPRDEPRDDGKGLADRVREIKQAAEAAEADPVLADGEGVAIPAVIPPGDVLIEHACRHRAKPSGTTYWRTKTTVDLAKGTVVASRVEGDTAKAYGFLKMKKKEKRTEQQTTLTPADVARIRTALDRVLAGGPYAPMHAAPDGVVCKLALRVGGDRPFFEIEKSRVEREDSVTRLIEALGVETPP